MNYKQWLLPPRSNLLLGLLCLPLLPAYPQAILAALLVNGILVWLLATPRIAFFLLHWLERIGCERSSPALQPKAIVVLGYGRNQSSLERVVAAGQMHQLTQLPLLLSGGYTKGSSLAEADYMRQQLHQLYDCDIRWLEKQSHSTLENAYYSRQILTQHNINCVYVATHAWHMLRARTIFHQVGLMAVPCPTAPTAYPTALGWRGWLPHRLGLHHSARVVHELLGVAKVKLLHNLKARISAPFLIMVSGRD